MEEWQGKHGQNGAARKRRTLTVTSDETDRQWWDARLKYLAGLFMGLFWPQKTIPRKWGLLGEHYCGRLIWMEARTRRDSYWIRFDIYHIKNCKTAEMKFRSSVLRWKSWIRSLYGRRCGGRTSKEGAHQDQIIQSKLLFVKPIKPGK